MKNMYLLLVLSAVMFSCSKDADDTAIGLRDFNIIIKVDPNYRFSPYTESFRAFLSDQNGNVLASGEIQTGQTLTLNATGEPLAIYDLSYMKYSNIEVIGQKFYRLITFSNIEAGNYFLGPSGTIENTNDEIYLNLTNTGYPCEETSSTPGGAIYGPENGGYYNYKGNLVGSPTSDFYISFKNENEQFDRYFWRRDVPEGSVFNIDYPTLPEISSITNFQIPSNAIYTFGLQGIMHNDGNNIRHSVREGNYPSGISSLSIPVPTNVFDSFYFRVGFGNSDFRSFKVLHSATIPDTSANPQLSFTVNNQSPTNFSMTTSGEGIIYDVVFRTSNINETVSVAHQIYGEIAPEITFSKENLRMNIQQTYPELTGFETLPLGSVSLINYRIFNNSYKDILKNRIEGNVDELGLNDFSEGTSKQFD